MWGWAASFVVGENTSLRRRVEGMLIVFFQHDGRDGRRLNRGDC